MSNSDSNPGAVKPCIKCGSTERYACGRCKICGRAYGISYNASNTKKIKTYNAARHSANPKKFREREAAYRAANPDKVKLRASTYYAANKEMIRAKHAAYYAATTDRSKARNSAWMSLHLEAMRIRTQNRNAKKMANGGVLSKGLSAKLFKLQKGKCACCGLPLGTNFHLDHIMPLSLGGLNIDSNIQLLRGICNHQKKAKHPVDFMQSRGFLL